MVDSVDAAGKVAVIGAGSWGTAAAGLVAPHATKVVLWAHSEEVASGIRDNGRNPRYLKGYDLPTNVTASSDIAECLREAEACLIVVPSSHLRATSRTMAPYVSSDLPILVLTKGIEAETGLAMDQVVSDELGNPMRVCALSGPNHAEEICLGKVSASVIAGRDMEIARMFQGLVLSPQFRTYVTDDVEGVEVCGAVKNVIAIAAGVAVGSGAGDNTLAVIMTRGLAEIGRIAAACGGNPRTCMGLAGMGDLIATCTPKHSRNRTFGEALVRGESLEDYEARTHMVVEGARAAHSVWELAHAKGVEVPITDAVHAFLYEGIPMAEVLASLLARTPGEEFYGFEKCAAEKNAC